MKNQKKEPEDPGMIWKFLKQQAPQRYLYPLQRPHALGSTLTKIISIVSSLKLFKEEARW